MNKYAMIRVQSTRKASVTAYSYSSLYADQNRVTPHSVRCHTHTHQKPYPPCDNHRHQVPQSRPLAGPMEQVRDGWSSRPLGWEATEDGYAESLQRPFCWKRWQLWERLKPTGSVAGSSSGIWVSGLQSRGLSGQGERHRVEDSALLLLAKLSHPCLQSS